MRVHDRSAKVARRPMIVNGVAMKRLLNERAARAQKESSVSKHRPFPCAKLSAYIHRLGPVGSLVDLRVRAAASSLGVKDHTIHSEVRDLQILGVIKAVAGSEPGVYTVRIIK